MAEEIFKPGKVLKKKAYLPGGGLPVVNMTGDPRGSRLLHWAMTLECCNPWRIFLRGYLYRIIFFRGGVACGPPDNQTNQNHTTTHQHHKTITTAVTANSSWNIRTCLFMYHAACKVEFQPFKRSYSQPTFFNFFFKNGKKTKKKLVFF